MTTTLTRNKHSKLLFPLVFTSLLGFVLVICATRNYGLGISPDSVTYIRVARNLALGRGLILWGGSPLVIFPPLYSILIALPAFLFKVDALVAARFVNAFLFAACIFLSGLLFSRHFKSSPFRLLLESLFVLLSIPLITVALMAWSELLFILLVIVYLLLSSLYSENNNLKTLIALAIVVALATLTRYAGIVLIVTTTLQLIASKNGSWNLKLRHLLVFLPISSIPLAVWLLRNFLVSGTMTGPRHVSSFTYIQNIQSAIDTLFSFYLPYPVYDNLHILAVFLLISFAGAIYLISGKYRALLAILNRNLPSILLITVYLTFLVLSSRDAFWQLIDTRYLSPLYVPLTLILLEFLYLLASSPVLPQKGMMIPAIVNICIAIYLCFPFIVISRTVYNHFTSGDGMASKTYIDGELIHYLSEEPQLTRDYPIYSNAPDLLYILANIPAQGIPSRLSASGDSIPVSVLADKWPDEQSALVVWFTSVTWRDYIYTPEELKTIRSLQVKQEFRDGAIYIIH